MSCKGKFAFDFWQRLFKDVPGLSQAATASTAPS